MSQKIISIPILPHLIKFLDMHYPKQGYLYIIKQKIIPPRHHNPVRYRKYFTDPSEKYVLITVKTNDSRLYKLYAWVQHVDNHFSQTMIDYVSARDGIMKASKALREYLSLYGITESEYAFDTAYKKWQRSEIYRKLKETKIKRRCQESANTQETTTEA